MSTQILEAIIYKPKPGISPEEALRQLESIVDPVLHVGTGMERIWRSRCPDGTFVDTLLWKDEASLMAVKQKVHANAAVLTVFGLFEEVGLTMLQGRVFQ